MQFHTIHSNYKQSSIQVPIFGTQMNAIYINQTKQLILDKVRIQIADHLNTKHITTIWIIIPSENRTKKSNIQMPYALGYTMFSYTSTHLKTEQHPKFQFIV